MERLRRHISLCGVMRKCKLSSEGRRKRIWKAEFVAMASVCLLSSVVK